jgi:hypothetical protein
MFAKILIKIIHAYIIHIYVYTKVNRLRVHYIVITLGMSSTQKFETYILIIYKHNFDEYYSCEHNMHKNK